MTNEWKPSKSVENCITPYELRVVLVLPSQIVKFSFMSRDAAINAVSECREHYKAKRFCVADVMQSCYRESF